MALQIETQWADIAYYSAGDVLSSAVFYIACAAGGPPLTSCSGRNSFFEWFQSTVALVPLFSGFLSAAALDALPFSFACRASISYFALRAMGKRKPPHRLFRLSLLRHGPMINVSIECHSRQSMNVPET